MLRRSIPWVWSRSKSIDCSFNYLQEYLLWFYDALLKAIILLYIITYGGQEILNDFETKVEIERELITCDACIHINCCYCLDSLLTHKSSSK